MTASKSRRARHRRSKYVANPEIGVFGREETASNATPELFVTSATQCFDPELRDWAKFDDDERWRETARTGRAL